MAAIIPSPQHVRRLGGPTSMEYGIRLSASSYRMGYLVAHLFSPVPVKSHDVAGD